MAVPGVLAHFIMCPSHIQVTNHKQSNSPAVSFLPSKRPPSTRSLHSYFKVHRSLISQGKTSVSASGPLCIHKLHTQDKGNPRLLTVPAVYQKWLTRHLKSSLKRIRLEGLLYSSISTVLTPEFTSHYSGT